MDHKRFIHSLKEDIYLTIKFYPMIMYRHLCHFSSALIWQRKHSFVKKKGHTTRLVFQLLQLLYAPL